MIRHLYTVDACNYLNFNTSLILVHFSGFCLISMQLSGSLCLRMFSSACLYDKVCVCVLWWNAIALQLSAVCSQ